MVEMGGIEPPFRDCRSRVLPLDDIPMLFHAHTTTEHNCGSTRIKIDRQPSEEPWAMHALGPVSASFLQGIQTMAGEIRIERITTQGQRPPIARHGSPK